MKITIGLLLVTLCITSCGDISNKEDEKTTTYYLIRHAEKDRSNPQEKNPHLIDTGKNRAIAWSKHFDSIPLDAVYSTDYHRTLETALPTAVKKRLEIEIYNPSKVYDSIFQSKTHHKKVLIVGHSNTTPQFANTILGKQQYSAIDDAENGLLFTIVLSKTDTVATVKKIN